MPNTKQAKKRMVTDERRRIANKIVRSSMRTAVKRVLTAEDAVTAQAALPEAMKQVDKCAKQNILHDNTAARMKSRMARAIAKK
ncbi:MAG: 30S ribosomal protein S20 [Planctomycetes bacterium]|nr:30S ribosomal protein S20 [Planctomycetota bacterium]MCB9909656.1 30S ribosomal protein S20 [Planctomycetota bacterium]MCB9911855.1 30S ribosomal protein S20 [Planctomycetota bacterium]HRV80422.1 30S ribosomal protein S20 [Planctomycetota bacterium]